MLAAADEPTVALVGFLDTKGAEHDFVANRLRASGCTVLVLDVSINDTGYAYSELATHTPAAVCSAAPSSAPSGGPRSLPRNEALEVLTQGASAVLLKLRNESALDGVLALGGSTTTALACDAMRALPIGLPKVCVSTMVAGDMSRYVGESDIALMPAIVDFPGSMNGLSEQVLGNAAAALAGMAHAHHQSKDRALEKRKKRIALSMFGVTTPAVTRACELLGEKYETVVFHCTGAGGRSMERLIQEKWFDGVLDLTTTELADEHCGGILSAGDGRLTSAGAIGIPQVVSLGALDMCNFGPRETVPQRYRDRRLHEHNSSVTVMRTSADECRAIGRMLAERVARAKGQTAVVIPRRGWSMLDAAPTGETIGPFWDPAADKALIEELRQGLQPAISRGSVEVIEEDANVNDERFVRVCVDRLLAMMDTA